MPGPPYSRSPWCSVRRSASPSERLHASSRGSTGPPKQSLGNGHDGASGAGPAALLCPSSPRGPTQSLIHSGRTRELHTALVATAGLNNVVFFCPGSGPVSSRAPVMQNGGGNLRAGRCRPTCGRRGHNRRVAMQPKSMVCPLTFARRCRGCLLEFKRLRRLFARPCACLQRPLADATISLVVVRCCHRRRFKLTHGIHSLR